MDKLIFGIGLLICGTLGEITHSLNITLFNIGAERLYGMGRMIIPLRIPQLSDFASVFTAVGVVLCIWGLIEKDKRDMKKVIFGTGLVICGVLRVFAFEILEYIRFASQSLTRHSEFILLESVAFSYVLIIVGIAFNIWGLIKKSKDSTPAV